MPNTKLVFVKLLLELADDTRFTMELNDSQKLDYLLLLLMAGLTNNEIPQDMTWFKSRFHLEKNVTEIELNMDKIRGAYKKIIKHNGRFKFRNFKKLHNYIYKEKENSMGTLKEFYKNSQNPPNIYLVISNIISLFIKLKNYKEEDIDITERNRYGNRIKELLVKAKGNPEVVKESLEWANKQQWCDWTLETVSKKWADFMKQKQHQGMIKQQDGEALKKMERWAKEQESNPIDEAERKKLVDSVIKGKV